MIEEVLEIINSNSFITPHFFVFQGEIQDREFSSISRQLKGKVGSFTKPLNTVLSEQNKSKISKEVERFFSSGKEFVVKRGESKYSEAYSSPCFRFTDNIGTDVILCEKFKKIYSSLSFVSKSSEENFLTLFIEWISEYCKYSTIIFKGKLNKNEYAFMQFMNIWGSNIYIFDNNEEIKESVKLIKNINKFQLSVYNKRIEEARLQFEASITQSLSQDNNKVTPIIEDVPQEVVKTVTKQATEEMQEHLYSIETGIFKPYQFKNFNIFPLFINGTIMDIETYCDEQSRFRPDFKINVESNLVKIPTFFFKFNGVSQDVSEYYELYNKIKDSKNCIELGLNIPTSSNYSPLILDFYLIEEGDKTIIKREKILEDKLMNLGDIRKETKNLIFNGIDLYLKVNREKDKKQLLQNIYTFLNDIPKDILFLISSFDFTSTIPKILIHTIRIDLPENFMPLLIFLRCICFDIFIFNPNASITLSSYIDESLYSMEYLGEIQSTIPSNKSYNKKDKKKGVFKWF